MAAAGRLIVLWLQFACVWAALQAAVCAGRLAPVEAPASAMSGNSIHRRQESDSEAPAPHRPHEHQQQLQGFFGRPHAHDRSITGVEVFLGGLATAALAIIFCYIRVTRRRRGAQEDILINKVAAPHQSPAAAQPRQQETEESKA